MIPVGILSEERKQIMNNKIKAFEMDYDPIGRTIKTALLKSQSDSRLIIGLSAAIKVLSNAPEGSLICILAQPKQGDSTTHIHEVLLEAFCYENDIYVIKVDSAEKLSKILGKSTTESCCLIQKIWTEDGSEQLTKSENILVDHCEVNWDLPTQPVIKLPAA